MCNTTKCRKIWQAFWSKLRSIKKIIQKPVFLHDKISFCPLAPFASSMLSQAYGIWAPAPQRHSPLDSINSLFVVNTTLSPYGGRQEHKMPRMFLMETRQLLYKAMKILFFFLLYLSHWFYVWYFWPCISQASQNHSHRKSNQKWKFLLLYESS